MPVLLVEVLGQEGGKDEATRLLRVHGTSDLEEARAEAQAWIDDYNDTFDDKTFSHFKPIETKRQTWDIRAIYKPTSLITMTPGDGTFPAQISLTSGGATATIYYPLEAPAEGYTYGISEESLFVPEGINIDESGIPQGTEVEVSDQEFSLTLYLDDDDVSVEFLAACLKARGKVNSADITIDVGPTGSPKPAVFRAGELKILYVNADPINANRWQFVFQLSFSENRNGEDGTSEIPLSELGFDTGSLGSTIKKDGHDYLDVYYKTEQNTDGDGNVSVYRTPISAKSHRIRYRMDFAVFGFPDGA